MKKIQLCPIILLLLASSAMAQDRGFGLGVILGEPTGLSGKYWTSSTNAIDGGLAWSFRHAGFFHVHADYLWHYPLRTETPERFTFSASTAW